MTRLTTQKDLYQQVTDKIVAALESGKMPWSKPWSLSAASIDMPLRLPVNADSGRAYSGVNILLLWLEQIDHGYVQSKWLTFQGARKLGGCVRKGEKGTTILLYKPMEKPETDDGGEQVYDENGEPKMRHYAVIKGIPVFNIEQCDGLPESLFEKMTDDDVETGKKEGEPFRLDYLDNVPASMGVSFNNRFQNRAYYKPGDDKIVMPLKTQFSSMEGYYATLLHECGHATGHADRLNRPGVSQLSRSNKARYAFEELIAEFTSAFTCATVGIDNLSQNAAYIGSWIEILKSDKRAIFRATAQAREAADFILNHINKKDIDLPLAS